MWKCDLEWGASSEGVRRERGWGNNSLEDH